MIKKVITQFNAVIGIVLERGLANLSPPPVTFVPLKEPCLAFHLLPEANELWRNLCQGYVSSSCAVQTVLVIYRKVRLKLG